MNIGEIVTFFTTERSVTGRITEVSQGDYPGDYRDVTVDVDGIPYVFGTGGHLGHTWTSDGGTEQWYWELISGRQT